MERMDKAEREEIRILKELADMSEEQLRLMREGRLEELLRVTAQRDKYFAELKKTLSDKGLYGPELKGLVKTLLEKDSLLTLNIESELHAIKEKMNSIPTRLKALRTYTRVQRYGKG